MVYKKNILNLTLLSFLLGFPAYGKVNFIQSQWLSSKTLNAQEREILQSQFHQFHILNVPLNTLLSENGTKELAFQWLDGKRLSLRFEGVELRSRLYRFIEKGSQKSKPEEQRGRENAVHTWKVFNGLDKADTEEKGRLSLLPGLPSSPGQITGYLDVDGVRFYFEPLCYLVPSTQAQGTLVFEEKDYHPSEKGECAHKNEMPQPSAPILPSLKTPSASGLAKVARAQAPNCGVIQLAMAADYSMVTGYGNAEAVERRMMAIINMVDGLYRDPRINMRIEVSELVVEPSASNTFGEAGFMSMIQGLEAWSANGKGFTKPFDVRSGWFYSRGGGTVGMARGGNGVNTGVVCKLSSATHVIRDYTSTAYSLMIDQAHELAHNFGAAHVDNSSSIMYPRITGSNDKWDSISVGTINLYRSRVTCIGGCNQAPVPDFSFTGLFCGATRSFMDLSSDNPTSWKWDFGDGGSSTDKNPTHTYTKDGLYSVSLTALNAFGQATVKKTDAIRVKIFNKPTATGASNCGPASLTLSATGTGVLRWYDQPQGGTQVFTGSPFVTPKLDQPKTYSVEAGDPEPPAFKLGPANNKFGEGSNFNNNDLRAIFLDVMKPVTLLSAKVYATGLAERTIEVRARSGALIAQRKVSIPDGESRVQLNIPLQVGQGYALKLSGGGANVNLYRNTAGADFPYEKENVISITGHNADGVADTVGYYYFFYDLEIREQACASERVTVKADIQCVSLNPTAGAKNHLLVIHQGKKVALLPLWNETQSMEIQLRDLQGRIQDRFYAKDLGTLTPQWHLTRLKAGLYLMEIKQNEKSYHYKLMIEG